MDIPIGFTVESEDFQLTDLSKTAYFKHFTLIFGFLACTVRAPIAHARALTGCTHNNNPACGACSVILEFPAVWKFSGISWCIPYSTGQSFPGLQVFHTYMQLVHELHHVVVA